MDKNNRDFIYKMFFRPDPPSLFRLAFIQLMREGVDFDKKEDRVKNWNLIIDRAIQIQQAITYRNQDGKISELHQEVLSARYTGE